jgi:hypothetical protein
LYNAYIAYNTYLISIFQECHIDDATAFRVGTSCIIPFFLLPSSAIFSRSCFKKIIKATGKNKVWTF